MHRFKRTNIASRSLTGSTGFTLIELLVVISIISLLISILLPALGSARQAAQMLKCTTQTRSIGQAIFMYQGDYEEYYPNSYLESSEYPGGWTYVFEQIAPYMSLGDRASGDTGLIAQFALESDMLHCPAQDEAWRTAAGVDGRSGMYGPNPNLMVQMLANGNTAGNYSNPDYPNLQMKDSLVTEPSRRVMFTDAVKTDHMGSRAFNSRSWGYATFPHFSTFSYDYVQLWHYWTEIRGNGEGGQVFADGHAGAFGINDFEGPQGAVFGLESWTVMNP